MKSQEGMKKHGIFQISKESRMAKAYMAHVGRQWDQDWPETRSHMVLGSVPRSLDFIQRQLHRRPFHRRVMWSRFQFQKDHTLNGVG